MSWCCAAHMALHLDPDTGLCFPFTVTRAPGVGRCVLAARDIAPGETIFR